MTVSMTLGKSGCSKSVCFNSSCLARIPASLPRLTSVLLTICNALVFDQDHPAAGTQMTNVWLERSCI